MIVSNLAGKYTGLLVLFIILDSEILRTLFLNHNEAGFPVQFAV